MWNLSKNDEIQRNRVRDCIIYLVQLHFPFFMVDDDNILCPFRYRQFFYSFFLLVSVFLRMCCCYCFVLYHISYIEVQFRLMKNVDTRAQIASIYLFVHFTKRDVMQQTNKHTNATRTHKIVEVKWFCHFNILTNIE